MSSEGVLGEAVDAGPFPVRLDWPGTSIRPGSFQSVAEAIKLAPIRETWVIESAPIDVRSLFGSFA